MDTSVILPPLKSSPDEQGRVERRVGVDEVDMSTGNADQYRIELPQVPAEIQLQIFRELVNLPASRIVYVVEEAVFPELRLAKLPQRDQADSSSRRFPYRPFNYRVFSPTRQPALLQTSSLARRVALNQNSDGSCLDEITPRYCRYPTDAGPHYNLAFPTMEYGTQAQAHIFFNSNTDVLFLNWDSFADRCPASWGQYSCNLYYQYIVQFFRDPYRKEKRPGDTLVKYLALQWLPMFGSPEVGYDILGMVAAALPNLERIYLVVGEAIDRNKAKGKDLFFVKSNPQARMVAGRFLQDFTTVFMSNSRRLFDLQSEADKIKSSLNKSRSEWKLWGDSSRGMAIMNERYPIVNSLIEGIEVVEVKMKD